MLHSYLQLVVLAVTFAPEVQGHGRLLEPPGRSTMWRFGFDNPANYDDMGLFCGGFSVSYQRQFYKSEVDHCMSLHGHVT